VSAFRIDLHVHTARYSPCAETVEPREVALWALRAGLHGAVLTEHDMLWEDEELATLQGGTPELRLFRGIECTTRDAHLVVIGASEAGHLERGAAPELVAARAHEQGAVVILAHPFRDGPPPELPPGAIDAVEVTSTSMSPADSTRARRLARRLGLPQVGSSDAHALSRIGWTSTEFPRMPADELELAEMIRTGRGHVRHKRR
jgi:predicted metal-dependent phosphoesterase TrpH